MDGSVDLCGWPILCMAVGGGVWGFGLGIVAGLAASLDPFYLLDAGSNIPSRDNQQHL